MAGNGTPRNSPAPPNRQPGEILLVEDNAEDVELTRAAFEAAGIRKTLHVVRDGQEALDFLFRRGKHSKAVRPDLVLLDLNLPFVKGHEVLRQAKAAEELRHIPIIVLTMSQSPDHVVLAYQLGAAAYIPKAVDFQEFVDTMQTLDRFWFGYAKLPGHSSIPPRTSR